MSLRSALGSALGHGAAGTGVAHWWAQRVSALALVPLTLWLLLALVRLPLGDYAVVSLWFGFGWNPVLLGLTLLFGCWHSSLGVQEVIEDYVHGPGRKLAALLGSNGLHALLAAGGLYAIVRAALRSPT